MRSYNLKEVNTRVNTFWDTESVRKVKKNKKKTTKARPTYLWKVEESWLTEQDVSQEHGAAGQHFDLIFTEMMAPQESTKVPGFEDEVMGNAVTMAK